MFDPTETNHFFKGFLMFTTFVALASLVALAGQLAAQPTKAAEQPQPKVVTSGTAPVSAPSDATVLFNGLNLDEWQVGEGKPAEWTLDARPRAGAPMTCKPGSGSIVSKKMFGDAQIHVEFALPKADADAGKKGQERGNSGVYIQGRYEVQVLDSYQNETYPDGQCAAIYHQHAPLVNVCKPAGEWQTYDIIFTAPKFDAAGKKTASARVTVIQNGIVVQNNVEMTGPTGGNLSEESAKPGPIMLQDHGNFVQYRNVWVRGLGR